MQQEAGQPWADRGILYADMVHHIVAFEPSPEYRSVIDVLLGGSDGFEVHIAETYERFLELVDRRRPSLVLVSFCDLPDPETTLADLRQSCEAPILAFVQSHEETKAALRNGADYDLPKPFDPEVFTIAVEAVLRRRGGGRGSSVLPSTDPIAVHDLKIYPERRVVERDGRRETLSHTEWQLFAFLLRQPGRVVSRRELAAGAWGPGFASRSGQAELYESRVRRKVERDPERPRIIETVRGYGYRLADDQVVRRLPQPSDEEEETG